MDKVRCVGGLKPEDLTKDQKAKLELFAKAGGNGLIAIDCFSNLNTSVDEEIPSGTIFYFKPDAIVDTTLISDCLFQTLAVSKVVELPYGKEELTSSHFIKSGIESAVSQFVNNQEAVLEVGTEHGPWMSELGGNSSFVGVFYQMSENHQNKDFFIVAKGTAPSSIISQLKQEINNAAPTYGQLFQDDEWTRKLTHVAYLANQNVQKNLAQVAEAYNVGISRMPDFSTPVRDPNHGCAEKAVPDYTQKTYSIKQVENGVVAFYNGVTTSSSFSNDKTFVISADPSKEGIFVFPTTTTSGSAGAIVPIDVGTSKGLSKTIKQAIKQGAGWNPEDHIGIMVPVVTKSFDQNVRK